MSEKIKTEVAEPEVARHRQLSTGWQAYIIAITVVVIALAANQLFNAGFFVGHIWLDNEYQYALIGLLVPVIFIVFPASRKAKLDGVPWYDTLLALITFLIILFFFVNAERILDAGWEMGAPDYVVALGLVLWLIVLEATRRAGGIALFGIVLLISLYPLYADKHEYQQHKDGNEMPSLADCFSDFWQGLAWESRHLVACCICINLDE